MIDVAQLERVWRVGIAADPLGFVPPERRAWSHRFDDVHERFGTLYCARLPETALREVVADLRPNAAAIAAYIKQWGPQAAGDVPAQPVTAAWRQSHVLAPARIAAEGPTLDLTDPEQRREVELRHAALLAEHDLAHLDLHEITTPRRVITKTIAAAAYNDGVAVIRFASRLDGNPCYALFEGRAHLEQHGQPIPLSDPAPEALQNVCASWQLALEPAAPVSIPQQRP